MPRLQIFFLPFVIFFIAHSTTIHCQELSTNDCPCLLQGPHQFFIGTDIYYANRWKEGGTKQHGAVYAVRLGYEYIKRFAFYFGIEGLWGKGKLHGKSANGDKLNSWFTDEWAEGRFGYTLQQKEGYRFSFTPYIGGGYAAELNNFVHPSPLRVRFRLQYSYLCTGFLSQMNLSPVWQLGLNFKAKYPIEGKNHVSHDEEYGRTHMLFKSEFHYRIDIPVTYRYSSNFFISLAPFYDLRQYGGQTNYPFDFIKTCLRSYGATFKLLYCI